MMGIGGRSLGPSGLRSGPSARRIGPSALHAETPDRWLREIEGFGSNPGALRMFSYAPPDLPPASALVVVLHGCEQTAEDYDRGAGWSALAEREGFALLFPQQQPQNNANSSFNWFRPDDIGRGVGEALSIQQMTEDMIVSNGIDRRRVFVTGFSAGGAMANVMLAAYPDVFAAGAIIAGLPYGAAGSDEEAVRSMQRPAARTPREWGAQVRAAFLPKAPWPRVAVWHGAADTTVVPANADALLTQWLDVHGIETPAVSKPGRPTVSHRIWRDAEGRVRVEDHRIAGLAHGAPVRIIGPGRGVAGPFFLDVGISATLDIAHSWGLVAAEPKRGTVQSAALRRGTAPQY